MTATDRSVMLSAAGPRSSSPSVAFYQPPLPFGSSATSSKSRALKLRTKDGEEIGTFSKTAGGRKDRGNAPGWQCPEAYYEPGAGVGFGVAGSHGVVRKEKRWITHEDEGSPGPIYYATLDAVKANRRSPAFSKASRFGLEKLGRATTPCGSNAGTELPPSRALTPGSRPTSTPYSNLASPLHQTASFVSSIHSAVHNSRDGRPPQSPCTFGRRVYTKAENDAYDAQQAKIAVARSKSPPKSTKGASTGSGAFDNAAATANSQLMSESAKRLAPSMSVIFAGSALDVASQDEMLVDKKRNSVAGATGARRQSTVDPSTLSDQAADEGERTAKGGAGAGTTKVQPGPGAKKELGSRTKVPEITPGPGHFLSNKYKPQSAGQWSMGRRFRQRPGTDTPGPGAYAIAKAFTSGKPKTSTFGRTGREAPSMMPCGELGTDSPGPMLYSQLRVHK